MKTDKPVTEKGLNDNNSSRKRDSYKKRKDIQSQLGNKLVSSNFVSNIAQLQHFKTSTVGNGRGMQETEANRMEMSSRPVPPNDTKPGIYF